MGQIEACVVEVIGIAQHSQDVDLAKKRIEQLFADAQGLVAKHFATAQRVWDQLMQAGKDANGNCKQCLDQVMEWLHHAHLTGHRRNAPLLRIENRPTQVRHLRSRASAMPC